MGFHDTLARRLGTAVVTITGEIGSLVVVWANASSYRRGMVAWARRQTESSQCDLVVQKAEAQLEG